MEASSNRLHVFFEDLMPELFGPILEHFEKKNYECAITLAAAGEGQCKEKTTTHLFRLIRAKFSADETNAVINWLKHPSGPNVDRGISRLKTTLFLSEVRFDSTSYMSAQDRPSSA